MPKIKNWSVLASTRTGKAWVFEKTPYNGETYNVEVKRIISPKMKNGPLYRVFLQEVEEGIVQGEHPLYSDGFKSKSKAMDRATTWMNSHSKFGEVRESYTGDIGMTYPQ